MENLGDKMTEEEVKHQENLGRQEESNSDHDRNLLNDWLGIQTEEEKRPFCCLDCGKRFKKNSDFQAHCRIHTGERPFPCDDCGKSFRRNTDLKAHRRIHNGETAYVCSDCGQCFIKKSLLQKHQKVHTGEKPYSCTICGKCFSQRPNLLEHQRVHTGEKPFCCPICEKYFSYRSTFMRHQKIHTGEKPHACSDCGKCFGLKSKLSEHIERIHSDDKPFSCKVCGKCFSRQRYLTLHEETHSDKRFSCDECGMYFNQKSRLLQHQKAHSVQQVHVGESVLNSDVANLDSGSSYSCPVKVETHMPHFEHCGETLKGSSDHKRDTASERKESDERNINPLETSGEALPLALTMKKESKSNEIDFKSYSNKTHVISQSKDFPVSSVVKIEVVDGLVYNENDP